MADDNEFDLPGAEDYFEDEFDLPEAEGYFGDNFNLPGAEGQVEDEFDLPAAEKYFDSLDLESVTAQPKAFGEQQQPSKKRGREEVDDGDQKPDSKKLARCAYSADVSGAKLSGKPVQRSGAPSSRAFSFLAVPEPHRKQVEPSRQKPLSLKTDEKFPAKYPRYSVEEHLQQQEEELYDGARPHIQNAAHTVLAIPELLERILLFLEPTEMFGVQRVNTNFRDIIIRSLPLRLKMYFVPDQYFVRADFNRLLGYKARSRLSNAVHPFRMSLFADDKGPGISVTLKSAYRIKTDTVNAMIKEFGDKSRPKIGSWRRILVSNSNLPLQMEVSARAAGRYGETYTQDRPMTGRTITLGRVFDEARWRTVCNLREGRKNVSSGRGRNWMTEEQLMEYVESNFTNGFCGMY